MPRINILPKEVYNLIAAGEVVERPMSVVKEMMENSVDAGAKHITVEIKNGGTTYIRITDDGCGIAKEDIKKVFISHATSKISTGEDLNSIATLGFRGEAMASIAAVSKVELLTKSEDEEIGTRYEIVGGEEKDFSEAGCPQGTTIVVRDIFFNVPARMKFLKKDVTEGNAVQGIVERMALSHPDISVRFIREGRQAIITSGNGDLKSTVYSILGGEMSDSLVKVDYSLGGMRVYGYTSKPHQSRKSRAMQFFFINGRYVKSTTAMAALEQAYKNLIMVGRFPACVLNLEIDPKLVDVNVHPAKIEVRFANEKPIFNLIYYGVKTAVEIGDTVKEAKFSTNSKDNFETKESYIEKHIDTHKTKINFFKKEEAPSQMKFSSKPKEDFWSVASSKSYSVNNNKKKSLDIEVEDEFLSSNKNSKVDDNIAVGNTTSNKNKNSQISEKSVLDEFRETKAVQNKAEVISQSENIKQNEDEIKSTEQNFEQSSEQSAKQNIEQSIETEEYTKQDIENAQDTKNLNEEINNEPLVEQNTETNQVDIPEIIDEKDDVPPFEVVGEAFRTYIIVQIENNLYYIDKHAAHERMLYEKLRRESKDGINSQILLVPTVVKLSTDEYTVVTDNLELLSKCGFLVEDFGNSSVIVRETPSLLDGADVKDLILEIAEKLLLHKTDIEPDKMDWIFHSASCRSAVKGGDYTTAEERELFVRKLLSMPNIRYCPHGRPVMIKISRYEIEKQFGRIQ